jgi:hypothetical protein
LRNKAEQTTDGNIVTTTSNSCGNGSGGGSSGARTNLAENDSDEQNNQESWTFHNQLNQQLEARQPTQELYNVSKMFDDKDREIERLKLEIKGWQEKMVIKIEGENDVVILSTDLLSEMFSVSRRKGGEEIKHFYLKAKHGKVIGYETDIRRSRDNNENTTAAYMLNNDKNCNTDLSNSIRKEGYQN